MFPFALSAGARIVFGRQQGCRLLRVALHPVVGLQCCLFEVWCPLLGRGDLSVPLDDSYEAQDTGWDGFAGMECFQAQRLVTKQPTWNDEAERSDAKLISAMASGSGREPCAGLQGATHPFFCQKLPASVARATTS